MNARIHAAIRFLLAGVLAATSSIVLAQAGVGKAIYESTCSACHASGVIGAPKFGDGAAWQARLKNGRDALYKSAMNGTPKGMPPKGGKAELTEAQIKSAVDYMIASGGAATAAAAPGAKGDAKKNASTAAAASSPSPAVRGRTGEGGNANGSLAQAAPSPTLPRAAGEGASSSQAAGQNPRAAAQTQQGTATQPAATQTQQGAAQTQQAPAQSPQATASTQQAAVPPVGSAAEVNAFNRLLRPAARYNLPAIESGIHDPTNDAVRALQPPALAFGNLPKSLAGNRVDWVKALENKAIAPRWEKLDTKAQPAVMDLNIVREVKGSMPDVVYPHKQHTEWLDCANCHPSIFIPQKGANQISMAAILLGQKCGVCHGKVAFPVSECRLCHSKKKDVAEGNPHPEMRAEVGR